MPREWLNLYSSVTPQTADASGVRELRDPTTASAITNGNTVRIWEINRSGSVLITMPGGLSYGDAEVYLRINFANNTYRFLSAPVMTQLDLPNVQSIELFLVIVVGAGALHQAVVNAHCIYEVL